MINLVNAPQAASVKQAPTHPPIYLPHLLDLALTRRPLPPASLPEARTCVRRELHALLESEQSTFDLVFCRCVDALVSGSRPTFAREIIDFIEQGVHRRQKKEGVCPANTARRPARAAHDEGESHHEPYNAPPLPPPPPPALATGRRRRDHEAMGGAGAAIAPYISMTRIFKGERTPRFMAGDKGVRPVFSLEGQHLGFFSPSLRRGTYSKIRLFATAEGMMVARSVRLSNTGEHSVLTTTPLRYLTEQQALTLTRSPMAPRAHLIDDHQRLYDLLPPKMGDGDDLIDFFGSLPKDLFWAAFRGLVDSLRLVHAHHFVHLDIKPNNLLWDLDGHFVLGDFGLAQAENSKGYWVGTMGYMAPELTRSSHTDISPASDMFSLGMTLIRFVAPREAAAMPWSTLVAGGSAEQACERAQQTLSSLVEWRQRRSVRHIFDLSPISALMADQEALKRWDEAALALQAFDPRLAQMVFGELLAPNPTDRPNVEQLAAWLDDHAPRPARLAERRSLVHAAACALPFPQTLISWASRLLFEARRQSRDHGRGFFEPSPVSKATADDRRDAYSNVVAGNAPTSPKTL